MLFKRAGSSQPDAPATIDTPTKAQDDTDEPRNLKEGAVHTLYSATITDESSKIFETAPSTADTARYNLEYYDMDDSLTLMLNKTAWPTKQQRRFPMTESGHWQPRAGLQKTSTH